MVLLLDLPTEIRLKIWSFCVPENVEAIVCHCFNDEGVCHKCWEARQCLTIEINEDIILPTPSILLVNSQTYEEIMFLYNSTHRQRALVDKIRLMHAIDRPQWRPAKTGNTAAHLERVLMDRLSTAAARYYQNVQALQPVAKRNGKHTVAAEVEVHSVNLDEPSSEDSRTTERQ